MKKILFAQLLILFSIVADAAAPVLSASATQACFSGTSKPKLVITSGSGKTSYVSGVINDPTDPAAIDGIYFTATNSPTSFTFTSSDKTVVPVQNITMTLVSGDSYVCKIKPIAVGFTTITIVASNGSNSSAYTISYAASAASTYSANTIFPTIVADASAVAAVDDNYFFEADDELNNLRLYSRKESGQSIYVTDITSSAAGTSGEEFDLEAASKSSSGYNSGNRIYWISSLGNSKSGGSKPYRDRVIATDISGSGASATLSVKSYKIGMRAALISWGDANGWNFTTSASTSLAMIPKRIDGFNIEGLAVSNAGESAYIGFRAPCVPIKGTTPTSSNRLYAVIAPVTNFETMMNVSGSSSVTPTIGEPILFDFGGLGIRDMVRVGGSKYIIVAGLFEGGGTPAIYLWDGVVPTNPGTTPIIPGSTGLIKLPFDLTDLVQPSADGGVEGHPEGVLANQIGNDIVVQLICDNGTVTYYDSSTAAKDLAADANKYPFSKFRVDTYVYSLTGDPALLLTSGSNAQSINIGSSISNIIYTWGGSATGVTVSGLPNGVTATVNSTGKNVMISGTPTVSGTYNYTVTTTQSSGTAVSLTGTISIISPLSTPSGVSATSTSNSVTLNWTPVTNANGYKINFCTLTTGGDNVLFNETFAGQTATSGSASTDLTYDNTWTRSTGTVYFTDANALTFRSNVKYYTPTINLSDVNTIVQFDAKYESTYTLASGNKSAICINDNNSSTNNGLQFYDNGTSVVFQKTGGTGTPTFLGATTLTTSFQTFKVQLNGYYVNAALDGTDNISIRVQSSSNGAVPLVIKNFKVYVSGGGTSSTCNEITVPDGTTNSYTVSGLNPSGTYTYQLMATNSDPAQNSSYTSAQTIGTTTNVCTPIKSDVQINSDGNELTVSGVSTKKISICDISGKTLLSKKNNSSISIQSLESGTYIIVVEDVSGISFSKKFFKK
jgi:hypothetical protein